MLAVVGVAGAPRAAGPNRAVPRLVALVPREAGTMRRVQATIRKCVNPEPVISL